jgi:hypothetical protein
MYTDFIRIVCRVHVNKWAAVNKRS